jgi:hypothetical protein
MNGPIAEPCARIKRPPKTSSTISTGSSHHFLRARM